MTTDFVPVRMPPIPDQLAHLPRAGGIIIPYVAPTHGTAKDRLAHSSRERVKECAYKRLCMLCGERIRPAKKGKPAQLYAFVGDGSPKTGTCFGDPWFHVACAEYTAKACPWLAGRRNEVKPGKTAADQRAADHLNSISHCFRIIVAKRARAHVGDRGEWHFQPFEILEIRDLR